MSSVRQNFELLKEAMGVWQAHCSFRDFVLNGEFGDGNRLVAWAESDTIGVRFYFSDGFKKMKQGKASVFMSFANAYVKWGAFVMEPESGAILYKNMLSSQGDEPDRVNRVRDWIGYCLGIVDGFRTLFAKVIRGEEVKDVFARLHKTDADIRKNWLTYAPHLRGSIVRIDRALAPEGRQIRMRADEVASTGDKISADLDKAIGIRERYAMVLPFVWKR